MHDFFLVGASYKSSSTGWIFSLKNAAKLQPFELTVKSSQHATYCHSGYGPTFGGGHDLYIATQCNANTASYTNLGHSYHLPTGYSYGHTNTQNVLAGSHSFTVSDYEVFYKE